MISAPKTVSAATTPRSLILLRVWLMTIAALVVGMVVVGGATRLTQSGLSITEWQPVQGVLPPLSDADWQTMFGKYQQIPQYKLLNQGMTLAEFKPLFWWEWGHRMLGRFVGLVAGLGLILLLSVGDIRRNYWRPMLAIFALGGLEGAVGWYMVASGLKDRTDVSQYRLALHLGIATLLIASLLWTALSAGNRRSDWPPLAKLALLLVGSIYGQILLGAFVAGLHAGLLDNTWPLMEGFFIPHGLRAMSPAWLNPFENPVTAQFDHRIWAYGVVILALGNHIAVWHSGSQRLLTSASLVLSLVVVQIGLGIWTLLAIVPLPLALLHQVTAMAVLAAAVWHLSRALDGAPVPAALGQSRRPIKSPASA